MLFNFFLTFALVFSHLDAGSMESVFNKARPIVEDSSDKAKDSQKLELVPETDVTSEKTQPQEEPVKEIKQEKSAVNVFKPIKIEKKEITSTVSDEKEVDSESRASSVFGRRKASSDDKAQTNGSRAANVFLGHSVETNAEEKQVVEVNEESLEGDYSGKDFLWPVEKGQVSSYYGWRSSKKFHDGVDISAPTGTKIFAVKDGKVVYSGKKIRGYGNMIVIQHIGKIYSVYAHNSVNKVSTGDTVRKGDVIGLVGNTGRSHGPHVHFEVRQGKYSVDPLKYFNYMENKKGGHKHGFVHEFK